MLLRPWALSLCHPKVTACLRLPLPGLDALGGCQRVQNPCPLLQNLHHTLIKRESVSFAPPSSAFYLCLLAFESTSAEKESCALGGIQSTVRGEDWGDLLSTPGFGHTPGVSA